MAVCTACPAGQAADANKTSCIVTGSQCGHKDAVRANVPVALLCELFVLAGID